MARLHEHESKRIYAAHGIATPRGAIFNSADEAREATLRFGAPVVAKAQIHGTSRAASGAIRFAANAAEAAEAAREIFAKTAAEEILIEERLQIEREFYLGFIIDDRLKRPTLLFSAAGGSGIEERAAGVARMVCSIRREPTREEVLMFLSNTDAPASLHESLCEVLRKLYRAAKSCEARAAEINPLALTRDGQLVALDARISVDDYAVFRHPELKIEIARELGHAPTKLEKIAWNFEQDDFRGTFYFVEILDDESPTENRKSQIRIGFHGAGGGGSMASLDAAQRNNLQPACYVDTSGNPPASKVYRAARIILSLPGIKGYFLSGSGVASQEQFVLARALIKAFRELRPRLPAVLRLGGNGEARAKELVERFTADLDFPIEAYGKKDSADFCAARLKELISSSDQRSVHSVQNKTEDKNSTEHRPLNTDRCYSFKTRTGRVFYDHPTLKNYDTTLMIESCPTRILSKNERGLPVLNISEEEAARGKCVECLACEFAAWEIVGAGAGAYIEFPIEGL